MKSKLLHKILQQANKHIPEICTGFGVGGMFTAIGLSIYATPKALRLIEEAKTEDDSIELNAIDIVRITWKPYVPAIVTATLSTICLVGGCSVGVRRNAALASAANVSAMALRDFREATNNSVGEKKLKEIEGKVAEKKLQENPVSDTVIYAGPGGKALFYDELSNQYFESDRETIRKVINDLNWQMGYGSETYISLSQFYDALGLRHTTFSDIIGWNIRDGNIELNLTTKFADDGRPCGVIGFTSWPQQGFQELY